MKQVGQRGSGISSEYVRELIRREHDRLQLRKLLLAGVSSAPGAPVNEGHFGRLRERARSAGWARHRR